MNFQEASEIIRKTYVLTEREKTAFIEMAKHQNPVLTKILIDYKISKNIHKFYDDLKSAELLSTQKKFKVIKKKLTKF